MTAILALADPQGGIHGLVFATLAWGAVDGDQCADGFDDDPGANRWKQVATNRCAQRSGCRWLGGFPVNRQMTMMLASASIPLSGLNEQDTCL